MWSGCARTRGQPAKSAVTVVITDDDEIHGSIANYPTDPPPMCSLLPNEAMTRRFCYPENRVISAM
jgi:hypothetical protein